MLRNFLEVLFATPINEQEQENNSTNHDIIRIDEGQDNEAENYVNIINEMEKGVLKNSVFHIFDIIVTRPAHRIVKMSYDKPLKDLWEVMIGDKLKMSALESEASPENKIPSFIQGFVYYNDFLDFFLDNYDGDISDFELTLRELDFVY